MESILVFYFFTQEQIHLQIPKKTNRFGKENEDEKQRKATDTERERERERESQRESERERELPQEVRDGPVILPGGESTAHLGLKDRGGDGGGSGMECE